MPASKTDGEESFFQGLYADKKFLAAMNANYTKEKMPDSVQKLKDWRDPENPARRFNLPQIKWGQYQAILTPPSRWPGKTYDLWAKSLQDARDSLSQQPNTLRVAPDDPHVPATKLDRADAAVRKCFNSVPPLALVVNVTMKQEAAAEADKHDLILEWVESVAGLALHFTMVCPYEPPQEDYKKKG